MRATFALLCMVALLCVTDPAHAQFRTDTPAQPAPAKVYDESSLEAAVDKLFSPEHFQMGHAYEMSYTSFGNRSLSMGMYTNSLVWQFDKVAARVDVSLMQPFGGNLLGQDRGPRLLLRNAEIAYRPTENTLVHFQVRQSPFGGYLNPYGRRSAYGGFTPYGGRSLNVRVGSGPDNDGFWN